MSDPYIAVRIRMFYGTQVEEHMYVKREGTNIYTVSELKNIVQDTSRKNVAKPRLYMTGPAAFQAKKLVKEAVVRIIKAGHVNKDGLKPTAFEVESVDWERAPTASPGSASGYPGGLKMKAKY